VSIDATTACGPADTMKRERKVAKPWVKRGVRDFCGVGSGGEGGEG
jgi:hypothetical protein